MSDLVKALLGELETELKQQQLWAAAPPDAAALASTLPFCYDTMPLENWLQFIFLPRMQALLDARLSWQNPEGDLSVSAWVKNLSDERYRIGVVAVADSSGVYNEGWGEPRMFGIDLRQEF